MAFVVKSIHVIFFELPRLTRPMLCLQVLISLKEILEALDEMIDALQHRLATSDRHKLPELEFKQVRD